jgi:hypothetical protein
VYELPGVSTDVPKHVVVVKDYTDAFVMCALVLLHKCIKQKRHVINNSIHTVENQILPAVL